MTRLPINYLVFLVVLVMVYGIWTFFALPAILPLGALSFNAFWFFTRSTSLGRWDLLFVALALVIFDAIFAITVLEGYTGSDIRYTATEATAALGTGGVGYIAADALRDFAWLRNLVTDRDWLPVAISGVMAIAATVTVWTGATNWAVPQLRERGIITQSNLEQGVARTMRESGNRVREVRCDDASNLRHGDDTQCIVRTIDGGAVPIRVTVFDEGDRVSFLID